MQDVEYCQCDKPSALTSVHGEWGYWDVCCDCDKPIEGSFVEYNHYDGEDHYVTD